MPKTPPLSTTMAQQQTGVPKRTIIAAIVRGDLRAQKLSDAKTAAYVIEQRDLDKWVAKRQAKASA